MVYVLQKNALYVLAGSELLKITPDKTTTTIASGIQGGGDGLEMLNKKNFFSQWMAGCCAFGKAQWRS
jgi:hypothetical protein